MKVTIFGRTESSVQTKVEEIKVIGGAAIGLISDVLNRKELESARDEILDVWGSIDILVNAAGGNMKGATDNARTKFF